MSQPARIDALGLDLDGVVRHFDPGHEAELCRRHGLAPGAIREAVFASTITESVITGRVTRDEWIAAVGEEIGLPEAVEEWGRPPASVDEDVLVVVDEVRATGRTVVILAYGDSFPVAQHHNADLADGAIWLATDDDQSGVHRVDLETGEVQDLGSMGRRDGEGEGIDATDLSSGLLHTLVTDEAAVPVYLVHLAVAAE